MATILVVDDAFLNQVLDVLAIRGGRPVQAQALDGDAIAPGWAAVLLHGNSTGPVEPVVEHALQLGAFAGELRGDTPGVIALTGSDGVGVRIQAGDVPIGIGTNVFVRPGAGSAPGNGGNVLVLKSDGTLGIAVADAGVAFNGGLPANSPAVAGSRGGNAALAALLTALDAMGLITDTTTP
jgi:hypothetical protein